LKKLYAKDKLFYYKICERIQTSDNLLDYRYFANLFYQISWYVKVHVCEKKSKNIYYLLGLFLYFLDGKKKIKRANSFPEKLPKNPGWSHAVCLLTKTHTFVILSFRFILSRIEIRQSGHIHTNYYSAISVFRIL